MAVHFQARWGSRHFSILRCTLPCLYVYLFFDWQSVPYQYSATEPGLQGVLEYFKQAYGNPPMYIHENGSFLSLVPLIHTQTSPIVLFYKKPGVVCFVRSNDTTKCNVKWHNSDRISASLYWKFAWCCEVIPPLSSHYTILLFNERREGAHQKYSLDFFVCLLLYILNLLALDTLETWHILLICYF